MYRELYLDSVQWFEVSLFCVMYSATPTSHDVINNKIFHEKLQFFQSPPYQLQLPYIQIYFGYFFLSFILCILCITSIIIIFLDVCQRYTIHAR